MGYYIEVDRNHDKAARLLELYPDRVTIMSSPSFGNVPDGQIAVCVVSNPLFDAVGIAYDEQEFNAFSEPADPRTKTWLTMDTELAMKLCPKYAERVT